MEEMRAGKDGGQQAHQDCCEHRMEATRRAESSLVSILDSRRYGWRTLDVVRSGVEKSSNRRYLTKRRSFDVGRRAVALAAYSISRLGGGFAKGKVLYFT